MTETGLFLLGPGNQELVVSQHSNVTRCMCLGLEKPRQKPKQRNTCTTFFTYIAVKIVKAQLQLDEFFIDSSLIAQSYNREAHADLMKFLESHSLSDGDKFCADLMRESSNHKSLALRILEVRSAYCNSDFEWDNLKRLSEKMVEDRNIRLMREYED